MTRTQAWSTLEDTYLVVALERQVPIGEIATELERPEGGIKARLQRLGYNPRSSDPLKDLLAKIRIPVTKGPFRAGFRDDIGVTVRSGWEANICRWFNHQGIVWEYEPRVFYFDTMRRGARSYLPDFWLPELDIWVEVKGRLKSTDKTKLKRFKKFCPTEAAKLQGLPKNAKSEAAVGFNELGIPIFAYYDDLIRDYADDIDGWER